AGVPRAVRAAGAAERARTRCASAPPASSAQSARAAARAIDGRRSTRRVIARCGPARGHVLPSAWHDLWLPGWPGAEAARRVPARPRAGRWQAAARPASVGSARAASGESPCELESARSSGEAGDAGAEEALEAQEELLGGGNGEAVAEGDDGLGALRDAQAQHGAARAARGLEDAAQARDLLRGHRVGVEVDVDPAGLRLAQLRQRGGVLE